MSSSWSEIKKQVLKLVNNTDYHKPVDIDKMVSYCNYEACALANNVVPPNSASNENGEIKLSWELPPELTYSVLIKNNNSGIASLQKQSEPNPVYNEEIYWD